MNEEADCIFCRIANGKLSSRIVATGERCLAFQDVSPVAPEHILVIPKDHISSVAEIDVRSASVIGEMILLANQVAEALDLVESGFRLVINTGRDAGQTVDHLHLHVIGGRKMVWPPG